MRIGLVLNPSKGGWERALEGVVAAAQAAGSVSYTHLTLPTICSV